MAVVTRPFRKYKHQPAPVEVVPGRWLIAGFCLCLVLCTLPACCGWWLSSIH